MAGRGPPTLARPIPIRTPAAPLELADTGAAFSPGQSSGSSGSAPSSLSSLGSLGARYGAWKQSTRVYRAMRADSASSLSPTAPTERSVSGAGLPSAAVMQLEPLDELVPPTLGQGDVLLKVTQHKVAPRTFRIDDESTQILWDSKRGNTVSLFAIRDVRVGERAQAYRVALQIAPSHEPRWISVIYQAERAYKALHLVALSDASFALWRDTLTAILAQWQALASGRVVASTAQAAWLQAAWDNSQVLDLPAVGRLCRRMGIRLSRPELAALFGQADTERRGVLHLPTFQRFVAALKRRPDVERLYARWATDHLSLAAFTTFVRDVQGEFAWSDVHIQRVYERHHASTLDGFTAFLASRDNAACAPRPVHGQFRRDDGQALRLDEPLSHYYISSSHNTYLEGGQWKGDSTVEGYVRALQQGARSVELDCWDGPQGQPQVTHGRTLTGRVPLDDVVAAIAQYAFVASPYPLILSLEVHNDLAQQATLAHILRTRLGPMLVVAPLEDAPRDELPSPEALRHRVLVKLDDALTFESDTASTSTEGESEAMRDAVRGLARMRRKAPKEARPVAPELRALLVYTMGVTCRGLNKKEHYDVAHMFSLSERKAERLLRDSYAALVKHNVSHLTRVYPSMTKLSRVTASANFSPVHLWAAGCQLAALNWQTRDRGMEQNGALFAGSGGYVPKPDALRVRGRIKSAGEVRVVAHLRVVSAQQLPHVRRDDEATCPFVALQADGPQSWGRDAVRLARADDVPSGRPLTTTARTPTVRGNGLAPVWDTLFSVDVVVPGGVDLAAVLAQSSKNDDAERRAAILYEATRGWLDLCFVRFQVSDDGASGAVLLATRTVSLGRLGRGYRHLALHDAQLAPLLYSALFVHTSYTLVVP